MKSKTGINIFFSHSVERLVGALSVQLLQQQSSHSLFNAPKVLVPNANMQRYLQLSLAAKNGVCANVSFPFLETGLFHTVNELGRFNLQHLNSSSLAWMILGILKDETTANHSMYLPIHAYFDEQDSSQLRATKQWQLSQKLAVLFLDYESQRPEMIDRWLNNQCVFHNSTDSHLVELEAMQKNMYGQLTSASSELGLATLFQVANQLQHIDVDAKNQTIHLFTPSRLSQLHRRLILQLGQYMQVNIYQLNVCLEYWEDMQTEQELRWQQSKLDGLKSLNVEHFNQDGDAVTSSCNESEVFDELKAIDGENALLRSWGKPGREALKLFSDIEDDAIYFSVKYSDDWLLPAEITHHSLLHNLQFNVLQRTQTEQQITQANQLKTIQMAAAPSIVREVEAVYNNILWNLKQDKGLLQNDIAILVTDMDKYRFVIEQVFETLNHQHKITLNYAIVDSSATTESRYAEAVLDLFVLIEDDFIRASVFKWLDNPCVQAANQFDEQDWQDWLIAADYLGIYSGFSYLYPEHTPPIDGVDVSTLYTWAKGLQRLHRSLAVINEDAESLRFMDSASIGQFSVLLETVNQYKNKLQQTLTAAQWEPLLNRMFDLLLGIPANDNKEQFVQMTLQQSLIKLSKIQPELPLSFSDIKLFIQRELQQIPASKGSYLTGGVVCAALQPMRPIPFKITYVLGMDEKSFPGQLQRETLDLTNRSRRIGDINSIENKNYLFLETLMCTREKMYLSYVSQDLQKDETIEPSPVLMTLKAYCHELIDFNELPITEFPIIQIPLESSDGFAIDHKQLAYSDWTVNFSYCDLMLYSEKVGHDNLPSANTEQQASQLKLFKNTLAQEKLPQNCSVKESIPADDNTIYLDANELAEFLINPQAAVLKKQGVNSKHPDDLSLVESEPQDISGLLKHQIFTDAVESWLENPQTASFNHLIQQHYTNQLEKAKAPVELFANLDSFEQTENLLNEKLRGELENCELIGGVRIGNSAVKQTPGMSVDAIELQLDSGQKVVVSGLAEMVFVANGHLSSQIVISSSSKDAVWNSKLMKPFINWCLWQLTAEVRVLEPFIVFLIFPKKIHPVALKPWATDALNFSTQSTIKQYLKSVISDYLSEQALFLPCELLNQLKIPKKEDTATRVPLLPKQSKAKLISYLAYAPDELITEDLNLIHDKYLAKLEWPSYEEILNVVDYRVASQPELAYNKYLMPLFTMVQGHIDNKSGASS